MIAINEMNDDIVSGFTFFLGELMTSTVLVLFFVTLGDLNHSSDSESMDDFSSHYRMLSSSRSLTMASGPYDWPFTKR
jgi:hypothetical protein